MRKKTVKIGLNFITAGVLLVIVASYFHGYLASLLFLSPQVEARLVYLALFWGSAAGCAGVMIAAIGILRSERYPQPVYLVPSVIMLLAVIVLFFVLLFSSFEGPDRSRIRPGETILI